MIGWNGFFVIFALILGESRSAGKLFLLATIAAIGQILFLRLLFFPLRLHKSIVAAAIWGGLTGVAAVFAESQATTTFDQHLVIWELNGLYIGVAVGLFLRYFYRDDRRIESEAQTAGQPVDYGRDAHWLEPFFFGAAAYVVAFLPRSFSLAVIILVIGAVGGVVAAGVSHFFVFTVSRKSVLSIVLCVIVGLVQGAASGLLFRSFADEMWLSPYAHGALGGALTYLMTAMRGRALASHEES
ncbi:MAG TPA: hypothetical protein VJT71_11375 [Pyrinomonadaceae bacterium]|nr:hypothetical protein [Pyrinomonadaceae bacterium]